jgi:hypothetical protein
MFDPPPEMKTAMFFFSLLLLLLLAADDDDDAWWVLVRRSRCRRRAGARALLVLSRLSTKHDAHLEEVEHEVNWRSQRASAAEDMSRVFSFFPSRVRSK